MKYVTKKRNCITFIYSYQDKLAWSKVDYPLPEQYFNITHSTIQPIKDFISDYRLKRPDGVICFSASVLYNDKGFLHNINSEVQIITLETVMAVYIIEFFKDVYLFEEMYCTTNFNFGYSKGGALEISNSAITNRLHIAIMPVQQQ